MVSLEPLYPNSKKVGGLYKDKDKALFYIGFKNNKH